MYKFNIDEKVKSKLKVIGVIVAVLAVALVVSLIFGGKKSTQVKAPEKKKMSLLTEKVEKDLWMASEGQNVKQVEKTQEELKAEVDKLKNELEEQKKKKETVEPKKQTAQQLPPIPPPAPTAPSNQTNVQPATSTPQLQQQKQGDIQALSGKQQIQEEKKASSESKEESIIRVFKESSKSESGEKSKEEKSKKKVIKYSTTWLPVSFMKVVLLNGIDAPTSGGAPSEPYPVLMKVTDLSILPNRYRADIRECFIVGAGYGNISDERAYIRTETLSCIKRNGDIIESSFKGHVIGEDGKLGMRGRLVSKQGQQIAAALFAGTLSGFGRALTPQQAFSINLTGENKTISPSTSDIVTGGFLTGVGNALNDVAKYFLSMAEKTFPVIEIDAGRTVEVVTLKGQALRSLKQEETTKEKVSEERTQPKQEKQEKVEKPLIPGPLTTGREGTRSNIGNIK